MWLRYLERNVDISSLSNFRTKAKASYFFEINSRQDVDKLTEIVYFARQNNLEILFVWAGTNMLFAFDKYNWIVIKNSLNWWNYNLETKILESYSNELISDIAKSLEKDFGQNLWHRFIWLPGTIWWAVYGNAWCFWLETENNFLKAEILDIESGQYRQLSKKEMTFSYRNSI